MKRVFVAAGFIAILVAAVISTYSFSYNAGYLAGHSAGVSDGAAQYKAHEYWWTFSELIATYDHGLTSDIDGAFLVGPSIGVVITLLIYAKPNATGNILVNETGITNGDGTVAFLVPYGKVGNDCWFNELNPNPGCSATLAVTGGHYGPAAAPLHYLMIPYWGDGVHHVSFLYDLDNQTVTVDQQ